MGLYRSDSDQKDSDKSKADDKLEKVDRPTQEPVHKTSTVNHRYTPISSLLTHVEGHSWIVNYYHQILGDGDEPRTPETDLDPVNQQYHQIQDFEIKVTDPLSFRYEQARRTDTYEGRGVIYPGTIIPHKSDVFIADIGDGRTGIFVIDEIEPMSIFMERCYEVSFQLLDQLSDKLYEDIKSKVVKRSHFIKDFLKAGRNPLLEQEEVVRARYLTDQTNALLDLYLKTFVNHESRYLLMPDQEYLTFDVFVSSLISRIRDVTQHNLMKRANWPRIEQIDRDQTTTVFDLLTSEHPSPQKLFSSIIEKKMIITDTWAIKKSPFFSNLYYSRIQRIVFPESQHQHISFYGYPHTDPYPYWDPFRTYHAGDIVRYLDNKKRTSYFMLQTEYIERENAPPPKSEYWYFLGHNPDQFENTGINTFDANDDDSDDDDKTNPKAVADYHSVDKDDYYVFTENFYKAEKSKLSHLEQYAYLALEREAISATDILDLIEKMPKARLIDQFYLTPILIILSDYCLERGFFTGASKSK